MNARTKYILLILGISAFGLSIYNKYNAYTETSFNPVELEYAKVFFGIGIFCVGLYYFNKNWRNLMTKIMIGAFGICLILNLYLIAQIYESKQIQNRLSEYYELDCEKITDRFKADLKNNEIKYFSGGLVGSGNLSENIKKYGIENFELGCQVYTNLNCYNELVSNYLKDQKNININELYE
ncbi:hypothetical protein [Psychroserpens burtonensis]|uniref:hypothetical protein n=1 Tax=Psychroserpens burtonensis TaxID=49278 RepID=UPI00040B8A88|nr:hypothetical protein [Psychroserpens burtonensis]